MDTTQRRIEQLWGKGKNTAEIADDLGICECDADTAKNRLMDLRYMKKNHRKCLSCEQPFKSEGNGNRVCKKCKWERWRIEREDAQR